ncbi:peptidase [Streptomyces showdoensis]|uniref:Peptidase n=1 Tax=Streptomyces showdoensis TaxID=68268 RepID=A0A2P2GD67_STREW|nr:Clp protease N-terminal domain-containing protein [Streptomyces showdoensis]KKZ69447.1 peptidase [Streptomyces showdoensis]
MPATRRAELEDGLAAELVTAVTGARRRALRDGDRQVDTAHLLHSLVEGDPESAAALGGPAEQARVLGYLVQLSIGYGLRWQRSVEDTGSELPVLRGVEAAAAGWSPAAAAALAGAFERAALRGDHRVRGLDLLAALAADPAGRAAEVLRRAGVDRHDLAVRIGEPSQQV